MAGRGHWCLVSSVGRRGWGAPWVSSRIQVKVVFYPSQRPRLLTVTLGISIPRCEFWGKHKYSDLSTKEAASSVDFPAFFFDFLDWVLWTGWKTLKWYHQRSCSKEYPEVQHAPPAVSSVSPRMERGLHLHLFGGFILGPEKQSSILFTWISIRTSLTSQISKDGAPKLSALSLLVLQI